MRRSIPVFFAFMLMFSVVIMRLWSLMVRDSKEISSTSGSITVNVGSSRGNIYDRDKKLFVNEAQKNVAVVLPTREALPILKDAAAESDFEKALEKLSKGYPAVVTVADAVFANGLLNVKVPERYSGEFLIPHIAGYCDSEGKGVCGIEKSFEPVLKELKYSVTLRVDANGRILCGAEERVNDEGIMNKRGVVLTIKKEYQEIVRRHMKNAKIKQGAAVLLDAKTGEILSMVSLPEFDIAHLESDLKSDRAPFVNRALTAVSVGSVYKTVVAAAALESGIKENFLYECTGKTTQSGVDFHCHNRSGHGELDMRDALLNSCNTWFINMSKNIDVSEIIELSCYMGLGTETYLADHLTGDKGIVPDESELDSDAARANIAFGQGRLTASPLQIAAMTAVFANHGIYTEPKLIISTIDTDGKETFTGKAFSQRVISQKTADKVKEMMVYCSEGTKMMTYKDCGGKTATAENGAVIEGKEQYNTWYSGFFPAENPRYVLTVFFENGNSGATDCIPVFESIAKEIK
ncbi:MAG: penicillin-binding protein 2 [Clostridia bacterium]|nr:penicillin-binding protein 2 [Clostridia bacterium]